MTEQELKDAFSTIDEGAPIYRALMQIVCENIDAVTAQVCNAENCLSHGAIAHSAGGLSWLMELKNEIEEMYKEAHPMG
jgi:hypothetical protein